MNSKKLPFLCLAMLTALAAISNTPLFGQAFYGSVVGTVSDQSGASLRGATVNLTNVATSVKHQAQSWRWVTPVPQPRSRNVPG